MFPPTMSASVSDASISRACVSDVSPPTNTNQPTPNNAMSKQAFAQAPQSRDIRVVAAAAPEAVCLASRMPRAQQPILAHPFHERVRQRPLAGEWGRACGTTGFGLWCRRCKIRRSREKRDWSGLVLWWKGGQGRVDWADWRWW